MHLREAIKRCNESEKNSTLLKACGKGDCFREPQKEAIPEEWNNLLAISTVLLEKCSGAFPWTIRVPQPWHYWHSGPSNSLWGVILSTDRMLTSIPALYLLNARSTPCPPRIHWGGRGRKCPIWEPLAWIRFFKTLFWLYSYLVTFQKKKNSLRCYLINQNLDY